MILSLHCYLSQIPVAMMLRRFLPCDVQIKRLLMPSASSGQTLVSLINNQPIQPPAANHIVYQIQHIQNISSNMNSSSLLKQSLNNISHISSRNYSDSENASPSQAEMSLINILKEKFPSASDIAVVDISGGCGSMYEVYVESPDFKGIRLVKQHQMVSEALKGEIKEMHGIRISTSATK